MKLSMVTPNKKLVTLQAQKCKHLTFNELKKFKNLSLDRTSNNWEGIKGAKY